MLFYFSLAVAHSSDAAEKISLFLFCCVNVGADNKQSDARWKKEQNHILLPTFKYVCALMMKTYSKIERE